MASPLRDPAVQRSVVLRNVTILRGKTSVEVHMEASAPVKPIARALSGPQRILVDLAGVRYDRTRRLTVNSGDVEDVRVSLFRVNPPVTRVVVDLAHPHEYRLLPAGSTVILAIDTRPQPALPKRALPKIAPTDTATGFPPADVPVPTKPQPVEPTLSPKPEPRESPAVLVTQPSEPSVSAVLPEVSTVSVPSNPAQLPPVGEEETTAHQTAKANKPGVVRNVRVSREKDAIEVHIEGSRPLQASASTLSNPERIIIDLTNVRVNAPRRIPVKAADVQTVSVALFLVNPLVTRVTVDLAHARRYHLRAAGNSLTVRIETDAMKTAGSPPVQ